jgi:hypothetical protein|tara:strand:- start:13149 stop:13640 length:492 start_codon:yes stop_codon:yes gene_type:complete
MTQLSGTIQQYQGRTIDYLAFDDAQPSGDTLLSQVLVKPGQSGAIITGVEKLVQRFLIELLTESASLDYQLDRGTTFITAIRAGVVSTSARLFSTFAAAEVDVRDNLRSEDNMATDPDDERYHSASLLSATLFGDTATLTISVRSVAGDSRVVIYPLRVSAAT